MDKLLEQIENDIFKIEKLTEENIKLDPLRRDLRRRTNAKTWQSIRERAKRLFDALGSQWRCGHTPSHIASLNLEVRHANAIVEDDIRFRFLFSFGFELDENGTAALPWSWRQVEIRPVPVASSPWVHHSVQTTLADK
jgi:hypothetical protein